ncbi:hypothetical protein T439DRAFT_327057 [Meredithblackwellia eburnea MCA 4105]
MAFSNNTSPVAFFGSTGGCTLSALVKALNSGARSRALVRTPSKLTDLLASEGVSPNTISNYLVIVQGNAKDEEAVKKTLRTETGELCERIVFGIGAKPEFKGLKPVADDPSVCEVAMKTIITAISHLPYSVAPSIVGVSSTGITKVKRDVPLAYYHLYHLVLASAHEDKRLMEEAMIEGQRSGILSSYTIVAATLLTSGAEKGLAKVKVGTETAPAIGYSISRKDVGGWIWSEWAVKGAGKNERVSLTF